ncbi:copper transporter [Desulforamulus aeronauticus]|uniref:Copper transport outer membrane protein, MctB n=1 Tax=Desulforamulus aeronauticus DSM 10349 TaxID=1121421 RepID=A0A1M6PED8_9FIRM|nr:copper transporter [Desulforamulus aeronauticus]SHK06260.1 Copper transport outer membrane protein, MctB [Desulforamulus aeronauticus DSM 10349]
MIIDYRYHIASLVAVFIALGIGILVGSAVLGNEVIAERQKQLADRLEVQLEELRQKNEAVQARANNLEIDNNIQRQFEKQVLPPLITGKLTGKRIAIVETNSYGFRDDLVNTLSMAGATVQSVTTILDGFDVTGHKEQLRSELGINDQNDNDMMSFLAKETARGILTGEKQALLNTLSQSELLKLSGDYGVPVDAVIFIGGSQDQTLVKTEIVDYPMMDYFLQQKLPVFGVEETNVTYSYMKSYQKKRVSTVDNVESAPGQLALVLAIADKPGHYGVKPTAKQLLPPFDTTGGVGNGQKGQGVSGNPRP